MLLGEERLAERGDRRTQQGAVGKKRAVHAHDERLVAVIRPADQLEHGRDVRGERAGGALEDGGDELRGGSAVGFGSALQRGNRTAVGIGGKPVRFRRIERVERAKLRSGGGGEDALFGRGSERQAAEFTEIAPAGHLLKQIGAGILGRCVERAVKIALRHAGERAGLQIHQHERIVVRPVQLFDLAHGKREAGVRTRAADHAEKAVGVAVADAGLAAQIRGGRVVEQRKAQTGLAARLQRLRQIGADEMPLAARDAYLFRQFQYPRVQLRRHLCGIAEAHAHVSDAVQQRLKRVGGKTEEFFPRHRRAAARHGARFQATDQRRAVAERHHGGAQMRAAGVQYGDGRVFRHARLRRQIGRQHGQAALSAETCAHRGCERIHQPLKIQLLRRLIVAAEKGLHAVRLLRRGGYGRWGCVVFLSFQKWNFHGSLSSCAGMANRTGCVRSGFEFTRLVYSALTPASFTLSTRPAASAAAP